MYLTDKPKGTVINQYKNPQLNHTYAGRLVVHKKIKKNSVQSV